MKTNSLFYLSVVLFFVHVAAAQAQQAELFRVGVLIAGTPSATSTTTKAFHERLHELGYREGQNLAIEFRYAAGKNERLAALAGELARLRVDVIAAFGAPIGAAQRRTWTRF